VKRMALDSFWKAVCGTKEAVDPGAETGHLARDVR